MIDLLPCTFRKPSWRGDLLWMIRQPHFNDVLFIFNDTWEQFEAFHNRNYQLALKFVTDNDVIRPYQYMDTPRAVGIPTDFVDLTTAKPYIDKALLYIRELLNNERYKRLAYNCEDDGETPSCNTTREIKEYILLCLKEL